MVFLLDTNFVSETVKPRPEKKVLDWTEAQIPTDLFLTAQAVAEVVQCAREVKEQLSREQFEGWIKQDLTREFDGRATAIWGRLMGDGERASLRPSAADAQIAAVTVQHELILVTQNPCHAGPERVPYAAPFAA